MDHAAIRAQLPALVAPHLPRNTRRFKFRIYDNTPLVSGLGFHVDPQPFQGKVVVKTDSTIIIKVTRTEFAVLDRSLVTQEPEDGSQIVVTPYARHHFDGTRLDAPVEEVRQTTDGQTYKTKTLILGGATTHLPVAKPRSEALVTLIEQLERLPAPDGFRRISHLLADANACDFRCVDREGDDSLVKTPPALVFTVNSMKFAGQVVVLYQPGIDLYAVELYRSGERLTRQDGLYFDDLGGMLERLIDDGSWRSIRIEIASWANRAGSGPRHSSESPSQGPHLSGAPAGASS